MHAPTPGKEISQATPITLEERRTEMLKKLLASLATVSLMAALGLAASPVYAVDNVSPADAYTLATTDPDVYILDVRTADEWVWVGHAGMNKMGYGAELSDKVVNISIMIVKAGEWVTNPSFLTDVAEMFEGTGFTLITMCRSGDRSLKAAAKLEMNGYSVLNMLTGFEGKTDSDGYRTVNGWKVDGLPYRFSSPRTFDGAYMD